MPEGAKSVNCGMDECVKQETLSWFAHEWKQSREQIIKKNMKLIGQVGMQWKDGVCEAKGQKGNETIVWDKECVHGKVQETSREEF